MNRLNRLQLFANPFAPIETIIGFLECMIAQRMCVVSCTVAAAALVAYVLSHSVIAVLYTISGRSAAMRVTSNSRSPNKLGISLIFVYSVAMMTTETCP